MARPVGTEGAMRELGVLETKNRLSELLDAVEHGEQVVITRRGRPVAKLVSATEGFDREVARKAVEAIREMRKGQTLGGISIKELIEDGRK